jgi:hypothetical protein
VSSGKISPRLALRTEACRVAAVIQQMEMVSPGCFGQAGALIRQVAAGDHVAPDDLTAAAAKVRLALQDAVALLREIVPPEPEQP